MKVYLLFEESLYADTWGDIHWYVSGVTVFKHEKHAKACRDSLNTKFEGRDVLFRYEEHDIF